VSAFIDFNLSESEADVPASTPPPNDDHPIFHIVYFGETLEEVLDPTK
jgi:hypothetical protein